MLPRFWSIAVILLVAIKFTTSTDSDLCSYKPWGKCSIDVFTHRCRKERFGSCYDETTGLTSPIRQRKRCKYWDCQTEALVVTVAVNGSWSDWGPASPCSASCGPGHEFRRRTCTNPPPSRGGEYCQGTSVDKSDCEVKPCPVNGQWGDWEEWSECTETGKRVRHRKCDAPEPQHGGDLCEGMPTESSMCIICAESLKMSLTPGRERCRIGKPTNFTCRACTSEVGNLAMSLSTNPELDEESAREWNITVRNTCVELSRSIRLTESHKQMICALKSHENNVGTLISSIKIDDVPIKTPCNATEFQCKQKAQCILREKMCDSYFDCDDHSDEDIALCRTVVTSNPCGPNQFLCDNQECVSQAHICDGEQDCSDGSDEKFCPYHKIPKTPCGPGQFCCANKKCVNQNLRCNHINECGDNSDEISCGYPILRPRIRKHGRKRSTVKCSADQFCCTNKKCVSKSSRCNSINDCEDNSDEADCLSSLKSTTCAANQFCCANNNCVARSCHCDKNDDCGDNSDEIGCTYK